MKKVIEVIYNFGSMVYAIPTPGANLNYPSMPSLSGYNQEDEDQVSKINWQDEDQISLMNNVMGDIIIGDGYNQVCMTSQHTERQVLKINWQDEDPVPLMNAMGDIIIGDDEDQESMITFADMIFDRAVSDAFLIDLCRNIPDINQVFALPKEDSLLRRALSAQRTQLSEYLIERGADVNFRFNDNMPVYQSPITDRETTIKLFELLVKSGRLIKDKDMEDLRTKFGDHYLKLSDCYDVFTWKYNTLKTIFEGLQNRTDAGDKCNFPMGLIYKALGEPLSLKNQSDLEILKSLYTKCCKEIISECKTYLLEHSNEMGFSSEAVDLLFDPLEKGEPCEGSEGSQVEIMGAEGESV